MYITIYTYTFTYVHIYVHTYIYTHTYIYIYVYVYLYIYLDEVVDTNQNVASRFALFFCWDFPNRQLYTQIWGYISFDTAHPEMSKETYITVKETITISTRFIFHLIQIIQKCQMRPTHILYRETEIFNLQRQDERRYTYRAHRASSKASRLFLTT